MTINKVLMEAYLNKPKLKKIAINAVSIKCPFCGVENKTDGRDYIACKRCNQIYGVRPGMKIPKTAEELGYSPGAIVCHICKTLIYGNFAIRNGSRICQSHFYQFGISEPPEGWDI